MKACGLCGADIGGLHWNSRYCESCRPTARARSKNAYREAKYTEQQAGFCSIKCREADRYQRHRGARLGAVLVARTTDRGRRLEKARSARKKALRRNGTVVSFTADELHARLSMFAGCWMCGGPPESIDHVKPISKGGLHVLANLRPACMRCNLRKRDAWEGPRHALAWRVVPGGVS